MVFGVSGTGLLTHIINKSFGVTKGGQILLILLLTNVDHFQPRAVLHQHKHYMRESLLFGLVVYLILVSSLLQTTVLLFKI